jgi:hypothetical protein
MNRLPDVTSAQQTDKIRSERRGTEHQGTARGSSDYNPELVDVPSSAKPRRKNQLRGRGRENVLPSQGFPATERVENV